MKNKLNKFLFITFMLVIFNVIPAYASNVFYWNGVEIQEYDDESVILPENVTRSTGQARGEVISTGVIDISNEGKGKVGLTIETIAHVRCDKIRNKMVLQKWDESLEDWIDVTSFEFEALQEDQPDKDLIYLINGVDVENLKPGTYRARGFHAVYLGDLYESFSSKTNGIQVTK